MSTPQTLLLLTLLLISSAVFSDQHILMQFELLDNKQRVINGSIYITQDPHQWYKGLQSSYLKLSCQKQTDGKTKKLYSTVDHFDGTQIDHRLTNNTIELKVVRTTVTPRLAEIRALGKNQCKALAPHVSTSSRTYKISANSRKVSEPFPGNLIFNATLKPIKHIW